jgi:hypothetical protein
MSDVWKPRKGDKVKMTTTKSLIGGGRKVMSIRIVEVASVTKAGYVSVSDRLRDKFSRAGDRVFDERRLKRDVFLDFHTRIEPATAEEIATIPTDMQGAREYARAQEAAA